MGHPIAWCILHVEYHAIRLCCAPEPMPSENWLVFLNRLVKGLFTSQKAFWVVYMIVFFTHSIEIYQFWASFRASYFCVWHPEFISLRSTLVLLVLEKMTFVNILSKFYRNLIWTVDCGAVNMLRWIFRPLEGPKYYIICSGLQYWLIAILIFVLIRNGVVGVRWH